MQNTLTPHLSARRSTAIGLAAVLGLLASSGSHAWELIDLGVGVNPTDISNAGTVVGSRGTGTTQVAVYLPSGGSVQVIPGTRVANAINVNDVIVGITSDGTGFVYDGKLHDFGPDHQALAINNHDLVAGSANGVNPFRSVPIPVNPALFDADVSGAKWQVLDVARVYPRGTRKGVYGDLYLYSDINDAGYAVGRKSRYGLYGTSTFLTTPAFDGVTFLPIGGPVAVPYAIDNHNRVVGSDGNRHAFLYEVDTGGLADLGTLNGGLSSTAYDINDAGEVVGSAWLSTVNTSTVDPTLYRAFLWTDTEGMVDLNEIAPSPDWLMTAATAINENGDIVGTGLFAGQSHGFLLRGDSVTPPPVANEPPVAVAASNRTSGRAPLTLNFDASGSTDPERGVLLYVWDFGDGTSTEGDPASHEYSSKGTYTVTLSVTDEGGLVATDTLRIRVRRAR